MARPKKTEAPDLGHATELTAGNIERLTCPAGKQQAFLRDSKAPGLRVRVTTAGAKSFVFESKLNRKTIRRTIGDVRAWSIEDARKESNRLRVTLDGGADPRELERQAAALASTKAIEKEVAQKYTFGYLLELYYNNMVTNGQVSAGDVRSNFKVHIFEAWPEIAALPAAEVTEEQIADIMRRTVSLGHKRTANKTRSYVRSAFQMAKQARTDPFVPSEFKAFNIKSNPASETSPVRGGNLTNKNPLSTDEMRTYWRSIKDINNFHGALLRLHLLTGGQRIDQLVRLKTDEIYDNEILLHDSKGRNRLPARRHYVPLTIPAKAALNECRPSGHWALSTDGGKTHVAGESLSGWAAEAAISIPNFTAKRLRSGVETLLSKNGVPSLVRGYLQSHGLTGVQIQSYDGHEHGEGKINALNLLFRLLDEPDKSNVVPIRSAA